METKRLPLVAFGCGAFGALVVSLVVSLAINLAGVSSPVNVKVEYEYKDARCEGMTNQYNTANKTGVCPKHFVELGELPGRCYAFIREPLTWFDARQLCMMYGADLAHIEGIGEHAILKAYIKEYASLENYPRLRGYWVGGHRLLGSWEWADTGEDITWTIWRPGQPDNFDGNDKCLGMDQTPDYDWNDIACHAMFQTGTPSFSYVMTRAALCKTLK